MAAAGWRACGVAAGIVSAARVIEASHANQHVLLDHRMRSIPRFPASDLRLAVRQAVHSEPRDSIAVERQEQWARLGLSVSGPQSGDRGNQANWQNQ